MMHYFILLVEKNHDLCIEIRITSKDYLVHVRKVHKISFQIYMMRYKVIIVLCYWQDVKFHEIISENTFGSCESWECVLEWKRRWVQGQNSHCLLCVEVSGKRCMLHYLGPPSHNRWLVHRSDIGSEGTGASADDASNK